MQLTEKEQSVIKELQTQEKSCVEKYRFMNLPQKIRNCRNYFIRSETKNRNILTLLLTY